MAALPPPPPTASKSSRITEDEISFIMQNTLRPENRDDPTTLRFIHAYLMCRDVRQSGIEAGINYRQAKNLRNRVDIARCIQKVTKATVDKFGYDVHDLIERVREIVEYDPGVLCNEDGSYKSNINDVPPEVRRAIRKLKVKNTFDTDENGIRVVTGEIIDIEFWDKMKGIELLGTEKDVFKRTTVVEHDVAQNMKDILLESKRKADLQERNIIDVTPAGVRKWADNK